MLGVSQASETLTTVEITEKAVKNVSAMVSGKCVCKIKFLQEGQEITVFYRGYNSGTLKTREIPPNHSIVGVYGKTDASFIRSLGFIVMEI